MDSVEGNEAWIDINLESAEFTMRSVEVGIEFVDVQTDLTEVGLNSTSAGSNSPRGPFAFARCGGRSMRALGGSMWRIVGAMGALARSTRGFDSLMRGSAVSTRAFVSSMPGFAALTRWFAPFFRDETVPRCGTMDSRPVGASVMPGARDFR